MSLANYGMQESALLFGWQPCCEVPYNSESLTGLAKTTNYKLEKDEPHGSYAVFTLNSQGLLFFYSFILLHNCTSKKHLEYHIMTKLSPHFAFLHCTMTLNSEINRRSLFLWPQL